HPVPVGRAGSPRGRRRAASQAPCRRQRRPQARRNVGMRYHDGQPALIEGLLARGDRRVGAVIERVWRDGGRFDCWSEHFSYERWTTAAAEELSDVTLEWFTTRE